VSSTEAAATKHGKIFQKMLQVFSNTKRSIQKKHINSFLVIGGFNPFEKY